MRVRTAAWAAGAVAVVVAGLVGVLATRSPAVDRISATPLLGKAAPAIVGTDLSGAPVSLSGLRGKFVLVNFFAAWCVPCQEEQPELVRWVARHTARGDATVLGVIFDDTPGNVRAFVARFGGSWPVVDDPSGQVALDYGVRGPPESYLVSPNGTVLAKFVGQVSADGLDRLVARALGA